MEISTEHNATQVFPAVQVLPQNRTEWPNEAGTEYSRLLRALNSWSREHDWPMSGNSWIAEEAVRRGW